MFYYEVATAGNTKGSSSIFTYETEYKLEIGTIVYVPLRGKTCLGFIVKKSSKPGFKTNAIALYKPTTQLPLEVVEAFHSLCTLYPFAESQLAGLFTPPPAPKKVSEQTSSDTRYGTPIPDLSLEQSNLVEGLLTNARNSILFGDTGSGKTRMYEHLIRHTLAKNKNVILLAPEIGLSTYLYREVAPYFPNSLLYHSNLTPKARYEAWMWASRAEHGLVVIGPRSALSLPLHNVGLIILDEAHDTSYRQEGAPYLSAKVLSAILGKHHQAQTIYGTATPSVTDFYTASELRYPIATISTQAVVSDKKATVKILDYADEAERGGGSLLKSSIISIADAIKRGGQALVLINRRGTARYVACDTCGHEQRCKTCDHLVVYHHDTYELRCHFCNDRYPVTSLCSQCGSHEIKMRSFGTKAIVEELTRHFPDVSIKRFDTDTAKKDHLQEHTDALKDGSVQIIVGTQMIAKGLDLPLLKTLVVLSGTTGNGFGGEERDFQLLYQVLGRAMRGHQNTNILIQTSTPDAPMLRYAIERDYRGFYTKELAERKAFHYPPFVHLMIVHISRKTSKGAQSAGTSVRSKITSSHGDVTVSIPIPNITERIGLNYRWHILVKSPKRSRLVEIANELGSGYVCELDPIDTP